MGLSEVNRQQIRDPSKSYVEVVGRLFSQNQVNLWIQLSNEIARQEIVTGNRVVTGNSCD